MAVGGFSERLAFLLELDPSNAVAGMRRVGTAAEKELGKADDRINRLGGRMQAFGAGAVVAAGVAGRALFGLAEAFEEAEAESRKLDQAMATNASFAEEGRDSFDELADSLQDLTGADGDAITGMLGFLGTLGRTADEAQRAAPLIVDLATRFGLELEPAARLVNNALEGNTSRLERLIGPIGDAEGAMGALDRTVGGFAERNAQTLSGQLEILKQNLGDVAEGIGGGVVKAVNDMIGPLQSGAEWFTRLDEGTQATIGSFAAYGTAAVGVLGASSFVIGSVMKMVANFKAAAEAVTKFKGAIVGLGTFGAIVGVLTAAAVGLDKLEDSMISARVTMADLARAGDEELVRTMDGIVAALMNFGMSAEDIFGEMAGNNIGILVRYRDALDATGRSTEDVDAAIRAEAAAQEQANATTEAGADALGELGVATDDAGEAAEGTSLILDLLASATQRAADASDEAADALGRANDELADLLDISDSLPVIEDNLAQALRNAAEQAGNLAEQNASVEDRYSAFLDAIEGGAGSLDEYIQGLRDSGVSAQDAAGLANDYLNELFGLADEFGVTTREAEELRTQLGLDYPSVEARVIAVDQAAVMAYLASVAATLAAIEEQQARIRERNQAFLDANPNLDPGFYTLDKMPRAAGGAVFPGSGYLVGENGPEYFQPTTAGAIVPNGGLGGGSVTININGEPDAWTMRQMQRVAQEILRNRSWGIG